MVRWLQSTVLGAINTELRDQTIAVTEQSSASLVMHVISGQNVWIPAMSR
jgi:hypothetical protein